MKMYKREGALSWVLGVFVYKYVEKPAAAFLKRKWK